MRRRWISLFVVFIVAVGLAIASADLSPSRPPSRLVADTNSVYRNESQTHNSSVGQISTAVFPVDYRQRFFQYATVDCPNSQIVRKMYINREPLAAIAASQTVPAEAVIVMETHSAHAGEAGRLVPDRLNNVFVREKRSQPNPDPNSGDWHSAWYSPSGSLVSEHQSSCIGCHTRVRDRDYLFTLPALIAAAQTDQTQYQQTEFGTSVCR